MDKFSDRLRRIRKARRLSQTELARASGLSQGAISSYETGTRKSTGGIVALARALDVNPVWLLTGEGSMLPDITPAKADATTLQDIQKHPMPAAWPFGSINPTAYWTLPASKRDVIEQMVAALIAAMQDNGQVPPDTD